MNPPFKFIMAVVAGAAILPGLSPATLKAQNNTYYGTGALHSGTYTGTDDSAFGVNALYSTTIGAYNTATGVNALCLNTIGNFNTADGQKALYSNGTGNCNVAVGFGALSLSLTGTGNVATGYDALSSNMNGSYNVANGSFSLYHSTTGSYNTAIGQGAGYNLTTGGNNIDIADANVDGVSDDVAGESNTIRIGEVSTQTATYIAGINGANVGSTGQYVVINGNGQLGTAATTITTINPTKLNAALAKLEKSNEDLKTRNTRLEAIVAQQRQEFKTLTAALKEQASLLQKVSAQLQLTKPAPQVVSNNN